MNFPKKETSFRIWENIGVVVLELNKDEKRRKLTFLQSVMRGGGVKMEEKAQCPLCNRYWPIQEIEEHAAGCTGENNEPLEEIADLALDEMVLECFICGSRDSSEFHAMEVRDERRSRGGGQEKRSSETGRNIDL